MDLDAEIISGVSIGGIFLGSDFLEELQKIYQEGIAINEQRFSNFEIQYIHYEIDRGAVSVVTFEDGKIKRIWCEKPYRGKYKNKFFPGMTIHEIEQNSSKQTIVHGMLILDTDFGAGFRIPDEYEDIDHFKQFPKDMVLEEIHIMEKDWW